LDRSEMRVTASALREVSCRCFAERLHHGTSEATTLACRHDIVGSAALVAFEQLEYRRRARRAAVDEGDPRELVEVAVAAGEHETNRESRRRFALGLVAVRVKVSGLLRA